MTSTFHTDVKRGKIGEERVLNLFRNLGIEEVIDVRETPVYQLDDVDFIASGKYVEVKTDFYYTDNLFFETVSSKSYKSLGCMLTTKADTLFYVYERGKAILTISINEIREWYYNNIEILDEITIQNGKSKGCLIPVERLLNDCKKIGLFDFNGNRLTQDKFKNNIKRGA